MFITMKNKSEIALKDKPVIISDFTCFYDQNKKTRDKFNKVFPQQMKKTIDDFYFHNIETANICEVVPERNTKYLFEFSRLTNLDRTYFATANIRCCHDTDCIILLKGNFQASIWINYHFVGTHFPYDCKIIYQLKKGDNLLTLELENPEQYNIISCRISSISYEESATLSLLKDNPETDADMVRFNYSNIFCQNEDIFKFMVLPFDFIYTDLAQCIQINVFERNHKILRKSYTTHFLEENILHKNDFDYQDAENGNNVYIEIEYKDRNHVIRNFYINVFFYPVEQSNLNTVDYTNEFIRSGGCDAYDQFVLNYLIDKSKECTVSSISFFFYCLIIKKYCAQIEEGKHLFSDLFSPGLHTYYYLSSLDNKIMEMYVNLPESFDRDKEYSLLINLTPNKFRESNILSNYQNQDLIIVDIYIRGMTFGSYIGEAAFFEALHKIYDLYKINKRRIYGTGYSAMSSAIMALASNYPGLFAGVLLCSGSSCKNIVQNLKNTKVYFITSTIDEQYEISFKPLYKALRTEKNFKCFFADKFCHANLRHIRLNLKIIAELIANEREPYPDLIQFNTGRNLHSKAFWISLHSIKPTKETAKITAEIIGNKIAIQAKNVSGIQVEVPPKIDTCNIFINGKSFSGFHTGQKIYFEKKSNGFFISEYGRRPAECSKGCGMLYPYFYPTKILTCLEDDKLLSVAKCFSTPSASGYGPNIDVAYEVLPFSFLKKAKNRSCFIIIDNNREDEYLEIIRNICSIQTDEKGYRYKETAFQGEYIVMQITNNPYSKYSESKILYINTNSPSLFSKHILLRRVVIPSYIYGSHPFWNNYSLAFDGTRYYKLYEKNGELLLINGIK